MKEHLSNQHNQPLIDRRRFLRSAAAALLWSSGRHRIASAADQENFPPARPVTRGPKSHFFGYYDKCPWDRSGRYLLAMEIDFFERQPKEGEALTIGMVDLATDNHYIPLDKTLAWNWQQGTMLQWMGSAPDKEIIYNSLEGDRYISVIRDVRTGKTRKLPRPIYALSPDGQQAVSLDFERVNHLRPGYGYMALPDKTQYEPAPANAGIYWMDTKTGENRRILDLAWASQHRRDERFEGAKHWFNHLQFNPSGKRFLFLHRWQNPERTLPPGPPTYSGRYTRMYTANADGTDARLLYDEGMFSHFDWRDDRTILAWIATADKGTHFFLIDALTGEREAVAEGILTMDGHCSYSPDRRWFLCDTYPDDEHKQTLMLVRSADYKRIDIGRFYQPPHLLHQPYRCDLHPRWNRDGTQVCIDSTHEGSRQMYVIDVSRYTRA